MNLTHSTDDEQATLWNGPSGRAWVETQDLLDQLFKPFEDLLVEAIAAKSRCRLLDVGCGTGSTTLAIARRLEAKDCCIGIDISGPMIAAARTRAERDRTPATFICANAQIHAFEPAQFDAIISRFGVMFFTNPVQAFANLRRSASEGAELRLIAWRSAEENPFMTVRSVLRHRSSRCFQPEGQMYRDSLPLPTSIGFTASWSRAIGPR